VGRAATRRSSPTREVAGEPHLVRAVLATLAYADVFDYPLKAEEVHRFLVSSRATLEDVAKALSDSSIVPRYVEQEGGRFALAGRRANVPLRQRREEMAAHVWPRAQRWARVLAWLPFVRMVAVTGALAVDSVDAGADIDYLVVARQGRVWLCRAFVTALARASRLTGAVLCPNYVLSEGALTLEVRTLYTAHELVQMVPLAGVEAWGRLCAANPWVSEFLPNAAWVEPADGVRGVGGPLASLVEGALRGRIGDRLEAALARWQVARLTRKIAAGALAHGEATFSPDSYKGHFDAHGTHILRAWQARVRRLERVDG
jgi:hypothetical protein